MRTAWAGVVAAATAGGLLLGALPSVPASHTPDGSHAPDGSRGPVAEAPELVDGVPVARTGSLAERVSPAQVVAVLERAERQAQEQGSDFSPTVAQAAAELGMLYTTYMAQQLALTESADGLRVEDAPGARESRDSGAGDAGTKVYGDGRGEEDRRTAASAVQVSYMPASETDLGASSAEPDAGRAERDAHGGYVTYEEVVVAAVRLANLLDAPAPAGQVKVQRPDQYKTPRETWFRAHARGATQDLPLRAGLLDAVQAFGGSTLGYANGRIPATVLCPLDFAPGHMLRCDAAERLTALSHAFMREFGYPIPITDSYRSYVAQVAVAHAKPHLAAVPGTSNHGWGLAVDLSDPISGGTSKEYVWLRVHGPDYGWDNPSWARRDGAKPEPWHFEFFAAGPVPDRAIDPSDVGTWGRPSTSSGAVRTADTADAVDGKASTGPRHEAAADNQPKDRPADEVRKPSKKAVGKPAAGPPSQPAKPSPDPKPKPEPEPEPSMSTPAAPPASPAPSPSPTHPGPEPSLPPSASPTPEPPSPEPSGSPTPSDPAPSPTPTPSSGEAPHAPEPSPSASAPSGLLSGLVKGLGRAAEGTGNR
ncbi:hypothetical protein GCM10027063_33890 [Promicromonospora xylanilytica]